MSEKRTKINGIICSGCNDIIYSRARHDFRSCSCGNTSIDGGFDYQKVSWKPGLPMPKSVTFHISVSREELTDDWKNNTDKFGVIQC